LQVPSGWTATPGSDAFVGLFFRQLTPADDAVTSWTFTAASGSVVHIRYVVIRGGGAVDAYTGVVNASGATHTMSLTTTSDDSLLVVLGASNAGGTWSLPAGWTPVYNSGEIIATRVQATAGATGNVTFTASGSAQAWLAMIAVSPGEPERLSARSATATRSAVALASRAALAAASRTVTSTVVAVSVAAQLAAASSTPTRTDVALTSEAVHLAARSATATRTTVAIGIEPVALTAMS